LYSREAKRHLFLIITDSEVGARCLEIGIRGNGTCEIVIDIDEMKSSCSCSCSHRLQA
jgi:hypothetical protein